MKYWTAAAALVVSAILVTATAEADENAFYVGVGVGLDMPRDRSVEFIPNPLDPEPPIAAASGKYAIDDGIAVIGTLGYSDDNGFRAEVELGYREGDAALDDTSGAGIRTRSAMLNLLYDIPTGTAFEPYIGGGIGIARIKLRNATPFEGVGISDGQTTLAYQAIAGVTYRVSDDFDVFVDYRYFDSDSVTLVTDTADPSDRLIASGVHHTVLGGVRYRFLQTGR